MYVGPLSVKPGKKVKVVPHQFVKDDYTTLINTYIHK